MKKLLSSSIFLPLLLVILSVPLLLSFFHKGYFPSHDGEWAVVRLSDMYREVKDGQIPPRFSGNLNFGYGYPLFQYAYPLPYYLGLPFFILHFGLVNSIKLLFIFTVPLSGLGMFVLAKTLWNNKWSGFISGLLYMYLPYRLVDLYVRGSLGESIASVLFPLILYLMYRLSRKQSMMSTGLLSLLIAFLVLTHNIMAVLFGIICGAYIIFLFFKEKRVNVYQILIGLIGGMLLSAFFWLPALGEEHLILLSQIPIADRDLYYVTLPKLLFSSWGYGTPTELNPFTYQIGLPQILAGLTAIGLVLSHLIKKGKGQPEVVLFTALALFFVLLMFPLSKPLWSLPLLKEINYPWTALLPLGFLLSLVSGSLIGKSTVLRGIVLGVALLGSLLILPNAHPSVFVDRGDGFYFTNDATTTSSHELMPLSVESIAVARPSQKVEVVKGEGAVSLLTNKSQKQIFSLQAKSLVTVRLNTIYFPGWHWYVGNQEVPISYTNPQGVMEATFKPGNYTITAELHNTPIRSVANWITLISLVGIVILLIISTRKKYSLATLINKK